MAVKCKNLPTEWGKDTNVLWTYNFEGNSWSSPVVWGNKVFISHAFGEKVTTPPEPPQPPPPPPPAGTSEEDQDESEGTPQPGEAPGPGQQAVPPPHEEAPDTSYRQDIYRWEVTCIDLETGEKLWNQVAYKGNPGRGKNPGSTYANETPATDGKRVYVYFGNTGLFCYDMDGNLLWKKNLGVYETQRGWGTGSSPVVYKDVLYVQVDNEENSFLVALNAATGEQIWKAERDEKTNYSTPYIWKNSVRTELVVCGKTARSYDLKTGKVLWEMKVGGEQAIPSPVGDKNLLYIGNAGGHEVQGTLCAVKAGAEGDITPDEEELVSSGVVWSNPDAATNNPSPLLYKGLIYILASRGGDISCFNAATGKLIYKEKVENAAGCWASPWAYDGKIYFLDEKGVTHIIKAGEKFEVLAQNTLEGTFWSSVAIAGDEYIFKGESKLYCIGK